MYTTARTPCSYPPTHLIVPKTKTTHLHIAPINMQVDLRGEATCGDSIVLSGSWHFTGAPSDRSEAFEWKTRAGYSSRSYQTGVPAEVLCEGTFRACSTDVIESDITLLFRQIEDESVCADARRLVDLENSNNSNDESNNFNRHEVRSLSPSAHDGDEQMREDTNIHHSSAANHTGARATTERRASARRSVRESQPTTTITNNFEIDVENEDGDHQQNEEDDEENSQRIQRPRKFVGKRLRLGLGRRGEGGDNGSQSGSDPEETNETDEAERCCYRVTGMGKNGIGSFSIQGVLVAKKKEAGVTRVHIGDVYSFRATKSYLSNEQAANGIGQDTFVQDLTWRRHLQFDFPLASIVQQATPTVVSPANAAAVLSAYSHTGNAVLPQVPNWALNTQSDPTGEEPQRSSWPIMSPYNRPFLNMLPPFSLPPDDALTARLRAQAWRHTSLRLAQQHARYISSTTSTTRPSDTRTGSNAQATAIAAANALSQAAPPSLPPVAIIRVVSVGSDNTQLSDIAVHFELESPLVVADECTCMVKLLVRPRTVDSKDDDEALPSMEQVVCMPLCELPALSCVATDVPGMDTGDMVIQTPVALTDDGLRFVHTLHLSQAPVGDIDLVVALLLLGPNTSSTWEFIPPPSSSSSSSPLPLPLSTTTFDSVPPLILAHGPTSSSRHLLFTPGSGDAPCKAVLGLVGGPHLISVPPPAPGNLIALLWRLPNHKDDHVSNDDDISNADDVSDNNSLADENDEDGDLTDIFFSNEGGGSLRKRSRDCQNSSSSSFSSSCTDVVSSPHKRVRVCDGTRSQKKYANLLLQHFNEKEDVLIEQNDEVTDDEHKNKDVINDRCAMLSWKHPCPGRNINFVVSCQVPNETITSDAESSFTSTHINRYVDRCASRYIKNNGKNVNRSIASSKQSNSTGQQEWITVISNNVESSACRALVTGVPNKPRVRFVVSASVGSGAEASVWTCALNAQEADALPECTICGDVIKTLSDTSSLTSDIQEGSDVEDQVKEVAQNDVLLSVVPSHFRLPGHVMGNQQQQQFQQPRPTTPSSEGGKSIGSDWWCSDMRPAGPVCCSHVFHTSCLFTWCRLGSNTCPLCKARFEEVLQHVPQEDNDSECSSSLDSRILSVPQPTPTPETPEAPVSLAPQFDLNHFRHLGSTTAGSIGIGSIGGIANDLFLNIPLPLTSTSTTMMPLSAVTYIADHSTHPAFDDEVQEEEQEQQQGDNDDDAADDDSSEEEEDEEEEQQQEQHTQQEEEDDDDDDDSSDDEEEEESENENENIGDYSHPHHDISAVTLVGVDEGVESGVDADDEFDYFSDVMSVLLEPPSPRAI